MSPPRRKHNTNLDRDLSPPRKNPEEPFIPASVNERKSGLISVKELRDKIDRKKKDDMLYIWHFVAFHLGQRVQHL